MDMFGFKRSVVKIVDLELKIDSLSKERLQLKEELEDIKLKKKMEEEDIKHMVKINNERKEIELEKERVKLEREKALEVAQVKDEYRDKTEKQLENQLTNLKGMYGEILQRLPNYNVNHNIKGSN